VCARGMCNNPSVDGKNRCEIHQQELDFKNAEVSLNWALVLF
jgi:hypothetical protein